MGKFIVIYHAPPEAMAGMKDMTQEEKMAGMKPWMDWKDSVGDALLDFGSPLMGGQRLLPDGSTEASTKEVTGYSMIEAENMEAAKAMLSTHPHLQWTGGCDIEVHECMKMGM